MSLFLPLLSSQRVLSRLYSVVLSLVVPFLLLSASHEGLFILALILNMFCWLLLELHSADSAKNKVMSQGLLYCTCVVHHLFHMAASFIKEHKKCRCSGKVETNGQIKGTISGKFIIVHNEELMILKTVCQVASVV